MGLPDRAVDQRLGDALEHGAGAPVYGAVRDRDDVAAHATDDQALRKMETDVGSWAPESGRPRRNAEAWE